MSRKSARGPAPKPRIPREMPELQKAYGELCGKLGNLSFQIEMLTANLVQTKKELVDIVNETQSRQTLDAANPAPAATEGATA